MWLFDISRNIYNRDLGRRISIVSRDIVLAGYKTTRLYTVAEEWHTPESEGDTGDWDYYTFLNYQDAAVFIAQLALKFNSPMQRRLMQMAERFVTKITAEHKNAITENQADQREREAKEKEFNRVKNLRHVYVFEMENNTVKIGVSNSVGRRRNDIIHSSGLEIPRWCYTKPFPREKAFEIEADCHRFFKEYQTKGEFFRITYATALAKLQTYGEVFEERSP